MFLFGERGLDFLVVLGVFSHVVGNPVCTLSLTGCDQNGSLIASFKKRWGLFSASFGRGGKSKFLTQVEIQVLV